MTQLEQLRLVLIHTNDFKTWQLYENTQTVLRNQVENAIEDTYIKILPDANIGYNNVTIQDMLQHLLTRYGNITQNDLRKNNKTFEEHSDPSLPIELLWDQIDKCVQYASDGNTPYNDE